MFKIKLLKVRSINAKQILCPQKFHIKLLCKI